MMNTKNR